MLIAGKDFEFFNPYKEVHKTRAKLPHWRQENVLYFVTFRLADSIPAQKLNNWRINYENWLRANPKPWTEEQASEYETNFARQIEIWLDAGHGECWLRDTSCARIVEDCLCADEPDQYRLDAWVIASNHVHVLLVPKIGVGLAEIVKRWKGGSARKINQGLGRSGKLWQKEYYDHIVRNQLALDRIRKYIEKHKP
ncbi:MAG: transposase [Opitutales bacterium]